jgi:type I restriction enzyme S subunit
MLSPFVVYGLNSFMKGDNSPSINNDNIISFQYPLPPLLEQYRIVDKIEKLFDLIYLINENKLSLEQYITQTKSKVLDLAIRGKLVPQDPEEEPASMLLKKIRKDDKIKRVSSDTSHYPFEVPEGWIACQLYEICDFERGVTFPSSAKQTLKRENTIACVRTANVQEQLELDDLWYIDKSFLKNNRKKLLRKNDIIISTANSKELVGKTSFVENINEEMCFGGFVMVIRTNFINNKFLFYYLRDCFYNGIFSKKASQTTNIANINTTILGNLVIKVPPPAEQQRIVNKIEEIFKIVDIMQENLQTNV